MVDTTNIIINLIDAVLEREQYGEVCPQTIELLKADLDFLKNCIGRK